MLEKGIISAGDIVQLQAGTDSHISICAIALCTLDAKLTSVINGGHAVHGVKQSIAAVYPVIISQIACQTGNVVIIHKVVHIDIAILTKLILDRMCYLKVVAVVVGGINSLVALVIGNAVKHFGICPDVGGVHGKIDGHIAVNAYSTLVGVFFQILVLTEEEKLHELPAVNVNTVFLGIFCKGLRVSETVAVSPFSPHDLLEEILH